MEPNFSVHLVGSVTESEISAVLDMVDTLLVIVALRKFSDLDDATLAKIMHGPFWISSFRGIPFILIMRLLYIILDSKCYLIRY